MSYCELGVWVGGWVGGLPVDELDGEVEGGRDELELHMHLDNPIHQDRPHFRVDFFLGGHVGLGGPFCLEGVGGWVGG